MKISVIGTGYVGLVAGVCFAELGFYVRCIDKDKTKIDTLSKGSSTIYEPNLEQLLEKNIKAERLSFSSKIEDINIDEVIIIAVGTPALDNGEVDLQYIEGVIDDIVKHVDSDKTIIIKSTVPVGTALMVSKKLEQKIPNTNLDIISNPEFLREGSAVSDFMNPDRIVVGISSEKGKEVASKLYATFFKRSIPLLFTDNKSAELIKYASNSYLACRISFINQISDLSEAIGANIQDIEKGIGLDGRIGPQYLKPGPGFGGSCFPKDIMGLLSVAKKNDVKCPTIKSAFDYNVNRMQILANKILDIVSDNQFKHINIAVLGVTFKANTDDVRYSPSIRIISHLLEDGSQNVKIRLYDPMGMENAKNCLGEKVMYCSDEYEAIKDADILLVMTEWKDFVKLDFTKIKEDMRKAVIFDLRNILPEEKLEFLGFQNYKIGKRL